MEQELNLTDFSLDQIEEWINNLKQENEINKAIMNLCDYIFDNTPEDKNPTLNDCLILKKAIMSITPFVLTYKPFTKISILTAAINSSDYIDGIYNFACLLNYQNEDKIDILEETIMKIGKKIYGDKFPSIENDLNYQEEKKVKQKERKEFYDEYKEYYGIKEPIL
jgi:hypothetical protein